MPLVHVLLPAFNAEETLAQVLTSIADQTLRDFECLVIDDGSTDATADIAATFDGRFRLVRTAHAGIVAALNTGLALIGDASGYIARVDADDPCQPRRFEAQVQALDLDPTLDLVATACDVYREDQALGWGMARYMTWANALLTPDDHLLARYIESPIAHSSVMARRDVFAGGYRDTPWFEDYDLWLRALNTGARFAKLPERLVRVRDSAQRTSRTDPRCSPEALMACKLHHLRRDVLATRDEVVVWGAGSVGKRWLRALPKAGIAVPIAVELHPRRIGKVIHGARVIGPPGLPDAMDTLGHPPILVAVGAPGAREDLRQRMAEYAYTEGVEYLFVA